MAEHELRPIERTVRRLLRDGLSNSEVAWRLRRSPGYVQRVEALSGIERPSGSRAADTATEVGLRPIERCVLKSLEAGSGYVEIASRLRRSPGYVSRVERLASFKTETQGLS
jgi:DNA-binding NarL/FixJ family response regulator